MSSNIQKLVLRGRSRLAASRRSSGSSSSCASSDVSDAKESAPQQLRASHSPPEHLESRVTRRGSAADAVLAPSIHHFNLVLAAAVRDQRWMEVAQLEDLLLFHRRQSSTTTDFPYDSPDVEYDQARLTADSDPASSSTLQHVPPMELKPSPETFQLFMAGKVQLGDWLGALEYFSVAQRELLPVTDGTIRMAVRALRAAGSPQHVWMYARRLFDAFQHRITTAHSVEEVVELVFEAGQFESVLGIYEAARRTLPLEGETLVTVSVSALRTGKWEIATQLASSALSASLPVPTCRELLASALLAQQQQMHRRQAVLAVYKTVSDRSLFDHRSLLAVVRSAAQLKQLSVGVDALSQMKSGIPQTNTAVVSEEQDAVAEATALTVSLASDVANEQPTVATIDAPFALAASLLDHSSACGTPMRTANHYVATPFAAPWRHALALFSRLRNVDCLRLHQLLCSLRESPSEGWECALLLLDQADERHRRLVASSPVGKLNREQQRVAHRPMVRSAVTVFAVEEVLRILSSCQSDARVAQQALPMAFLGHALERQWISPPVACFLVARSGADRFPRRNLFFDGAILAECLAHPEARFAQAVWSLLRAASAALPLIPESVSRCIALVVEGTHPHSAQLGRQLVAFLIHRLASAGACHGTAFTAHLSSDDTSLTTICVDLLPWAVRRCPTDGVQLAMVVLRLWPSPCVRSMRQLCAVVRTAFDASGKQTATSEVTLLLDLLTLRCSHVETARDIGALLELLVTNARAATAKDAVSQVVRCIEGLASHFPQGVVELHPLTLLDKVRFAKAAPGGAPHADTERSALRAILGTIVKLPRDVVIRCVGGNCSSRSSNGDSRALLRYLSFLVLDAELVLALSTAVATPDGVNELLLWILCCGCAAVGRKAGWANVPHIVDSLSDVWLPAWLRRTASLHDASAREATLSRWGFLAHLLRGKGGTEVMFCAARHAAASVAAQLLSFLFRTAVRHEMIRMSEGSRVHPDEVPALLAMAPDDRAFELVWSTLTGRFPGFVEDDGRLREALLLMEQAPLATMRLGAARMFRSLTQCLSPVLRHASFLELVMRVALSAGSALTHAISVHTGLWRVVAQSPQKWLPELSKQPTFCWGLLHAALDKRPEAMLQDGVVDWLMSLNQPQHLSKVVAATTSSHVFTSQCAVWSIILQRCQGCYTNSGTSGVSAVAQWWNALVASSGHDPPTGPVVPLRASIGRWLLLIANGSCDVNTMPWEELYELPAAWQTQIASWARRRVEALAVEDPSHQGSVACLAAALMVAITLRQPLAIQSTATSFSLRCFDALHILHRSKLARVPEWVNVFGLTCAAQIAKDVVAELRPWCGEKFNGATIPSDTCIADRLRLIRLCVHEIATRMTESGGTTLDCFASCCVMLGHWKELAMVLSRAPLPDSATAPSSGATTSFARNVGTMEVLQTQRMLWVVAASWSTKGDILPSSADGHAAFAAVLPQDPQRREAFVQVFRHCRAALHRALSSAASDAESSPKSPLPHPMRVVEAAYTAFVIAHGSRPAAPPQASWEIALKEWQRGPSRTAFCEQDVELLQRVCRESTGSVSARAALLAYPYAQVASRIPQTLCEAAMASCASWEEGVELVLHSRRSVPHGGPIQRYLMFLCLESTRLGRWSSASENNKPPCRFLRPHQSWTIALHLLHSTTDGSFQRLHQRHLIEVMRHCVSRPAELARLYDAYRAAGYARQEGINGLLTLLMCAKVCYDKDMVFRAEREFVSTAHELSDRNRMKMINELTSMSVRGVLSVSEQHDLNQRLMSQLKLSEAEATIFF